MAEFFDLSIPYLERDAAPAADNKSRKDARLRAVVRAMELGYAAVAYDRPFRGVISDADHCKIAAFPISSLLKAAPALASSASFHRGLVGASLSSPFRQYSRITVAVDSAPAASALNSRNPILRTYDLVAARPLNQLAFDQACKVSEVDLIAIDFSQKLPFRLKLPMIEAAVERGVHFEITYSNLISDAHVRRQMLSDGKLLVDWTRGKNLIISSAAATISEIRGPYNVANLCVYLLGLSMERAKAAICRNCRSLVANALRKKHFYKEVIRVERIIPDDRVDSKAAWFGDWNNWDPISSGEGDLPPLDDVAKFFSAAIDKPKSSVRIDFMSFVNGTQTKEAPGEDNLLGLSQSAPFSLPREHGLHSSADKVPSASANGVTQKDIFTESSVEKQIPKAVMPLVQEPFDHKVDSVSHGDVRKLSADVKEVSLAVADAEESETVNGCGVGMLACSTELAEDNLVKSDANSGKLHVGNNIEPSIIGVYGHNYPDEHVMASTAVENVVTEHTDCTPSVPNDQVLFDNIENIYETKVDRNIASIVEIEQKDQVLIADGIDLKDFVKPSTTEIEEDAFPVPNDIHMKDALDETKEQNRTGTLPFDTGALLDEVLGKTENQTKIESVDAFPVANDIYMKDALDETKEKNRTGTLPFDTGALLDEVLGKAEDQTKIESLAADGVNHNGSTSGKQKHKHRSTNPAYLLPFKGLFKPVLFKKKVSRLKRCKHL